MLETKSEVKEHLELSIFMEALPATLSWCRCSRFIMLVGKSISYR